MIQKSKIILLALWFFIAGSLSLRAQINEVAIDSLVETALQKLKVAGAAVAIVKDGKVVHSKGYGVKSVATGEKTDANTLFAIASNSKAFTTAALAILVEEGKISWHDRVVDHIPEFTMYNPYVTSNFLITDLLSHHSGLGLGNGDLMFFPDSSNFTIEDVLSCYSHFQPQMPFRTTFAYNNLLYLVAGELIKRKSGMSWEAFVQARILDPLGMTQSSPALSQVKNPQSLASPHNTNKGELHAFANYSDMINGAAAGIYSSANDMSQWMLMQLNEGKYGDSLEHSIFNKASQNEMWKIYTTTRASNNPRYNTRFAGYGLGWGLKDMCGHLTASHTGGLPGMLSITILIPDLNFGVAVLTNTEPGGAALFMAISQTIADNYLGLDDFGWIEKNAARFEHMELADTITDQVWEKVKQNADHSPETAIYTGVYEDDWFGKIEVCSVDGQLWFKSYRSPRLKGRMHFYQANTFAIRWDYRDMNADAFATFSLDENGRAQSIEMKGISPNIDFSFDFHDLSLKRVE